jgi:methyl-accepting chemotaxis protein
MNQMDRTTQQNAAMVEETTAASHALVKETEELTHLINRFHTGRDRAVVQLPEIELPAPRLRRMDSAMGAGKAAAAF